MRVGFDVWRAAEASARSVLEVFPHAVFAVLHGSRPASKQTVAGRRARLAALRRELVLPAGTDLWSHDAIDAAGAAVVAAHHLQGRAVPAACGRHEAGVMWLPEASPPHPDTVDR